MTAPDTIAARLAPLFAELEQASHRRAATEAKKDPRAHKLSRVMDGPLRYRFYRAGKDGRGRQIRFCYATVRNVAGYYLGWREVIGKTGGHRDQWTASKVRRRVAERAKARAERFRASREDRLPPDPFNDQAAAAEGR